MRHAYDSDVDVVSPDIVIQEIPLREINAVNTENKIRAKTGDKKRKTYGKRKIPSYLLD